MFSVFLGLSLFASGLNADSLPDRPLTATPVHDSYDKIAGALTKDGANWVFTMTNECSIRLEGSSTEASASTQSFITSPAFLSALYKASTTLTSQDRLCQHLKTHAEDFSPAMLQKDPYLAKYTLQALDTWVQNGLPPLNTETFIPAPDCQLGQSVCAGIIPFKLGDIDAKCSAGNLQKYMDAGIRCLAIYMPIHTLGDATTPFNYQGTATSTRVMLNAPSVGEYERCVTRLAQAKLGITIVPHFEWVSTQTGSDDERWRMYMVPDVLANYDVAYKPVFDALKGVAENVPKLSISLAGELDNGLLTRLGDMKKLVAKLQEDALTLGLQNKLELTFNPNGDEAFSRFEFSPYLKAAYQSSICSDAVSFLTETKLKIGPSLYDAYDQVQPVDKELAPSLGSTINTYANRWVYEGYKRVCGSHPHFETLADTLYRTFQYSFYFGEFSLNLKGRNGYLYRTVADAAVGGMSTNLWTSGQNSTDPFVAEDFQPALLREALCGPSASA